MPFSILPRRVHVELIVACLLHYCLIDYFVTAAVTTLIGQSSQVGLSAYCFLTSCSRPLVDFIEYWVGHHCFVGTVIDLQGFGSVELTVV